MSKEPTSRHGRNKEPEPDDPVELVMTPLPGGDPKIMVTCLIEEYARMGMGEVEIRELFRQPIYQTHALYREQGEAWIHDLIRRVLARTARIRVSVKVFHHSGGDDA